MVTNEDCNWLLSPSDNFVVQASAIINNRLEYPPVDASDIELPEDDPRVMAHLGSKANAVYDNSEPVARGSCCACIDVSHQHHTRATGNGLRAPGFGLRASRFGIRTSCFRNKLKISCWPNLKSRVSHQNLKSRVSHQTLKSRVGQI